MGWNSIEASRLSEMRDASNGKRCQSCQSEWLCPAIRTHRRTGLFRSIATLLWSGAHIEVRADLGSRSGVVVFTYGAFSRLPFRALSLRGRRLLFSTILK